MQWKIKEKLRSSQKEKRREEIVKLLLKNRNIYMNRERDEFFRPQLPESITPNQIGINANQLRLATKRIKAALKDNELVIIYGDYDADGICATAILWEMLRQIGMNVMPFVPHRERHGYGLSIKGIDEIMKEYTKTKLMITVDNGIVAFDAVEYAKQKGIDVIICDHHEKAKKLPKAYAILHSTKLAGAGVSWIVGKTILGLWKKEKSAKDTLDLATIGSIADMVPLVGPNRSIVKHGIEYLQRSKRQGIIELSKVSGIDTSQIDTYHINFLLAPRINAMGRLEHALDSLRLLCTKDSAKAKQLAEKLSLTNKQRQEMTDGSLELARQFVHERQRTDNQEIIIIEHEEFHEGIIGLIAGKLVEEFNRPVVVIAKREKISKASARSIEGFNIINVIRKTSDVLIDVGGHPLAAGFTIETDKIEIFKKKLFAISKKYFKEGNTQKQINIDCEIDLDDINWALFEELEKFKPFGVANPQPIFCFIGAVIEVRLLGANRQHLKIFLKKGNKIIPVLFFNRRDLKGEIEEKLPVTIAGYLTHNIWNGRDELQITGIDAKHIVL